MLFEFSAKCFTHHLFFNRLPVFTKWLGTITPHASGDHGGRNPTDLFAVFFIKEFLCLKIVFGGGPGIPVNLDGPGGKVRKITVVIAGAVEIYDGVLHDVLDPLCSNGH
ncbi:hypothetical protein DP20_2718 [Shigella flexneri]|nr:hypothetical protein DP20_2718 [Shigella flexneri]